MPEHTEKTLQAIKFDKNAKTLDILDQLLLPYSTHYISIKTIEDAFQAIKLMQVRGAPAIAIVGAFAVVVDTYSYLQSGKKDKTIKDLFKSIDYLITSRPTAVNLSNALNDIKDLISKKHGLEETSVVDEAVFELIYNYSVALFEDDLANNFKIGDNGLNYIKETLKSEGFKGPFSIVTICNTGSLATSGHGTALGIIRSTYNKLKQSESKEDFYLEHVYPCETRPYNQGAKLTTYELNYEQIPFTLICDNMVSSLVNTLSDKKAIKQIAAPVKFIIVGADRVVKNGDTANKIGTFQLSTIANYFNTNKFEGTTNKIKFIVAAPRTTIDLNTKSGDDIVIEERPANELTTLRGPVLSENGVGEKYTVGIATPGISVWNPAFDVTPHQLIDAIVTEETTVYTKNSEGEFVLTK
ncbi:Methylthioribose-1-phosphate isomerase [Scheffersomyces xylosifermentans]|uniref:Methylthioribose-1-phosphate isomerase n=1 Tax=Scheffersomyces xylosifermentans TaxID=1304137 RepID=UPI00315CDB7D